MERMEVGRITALFLDKAMVWPNRITKSVLTKCGSLSYSFLCFLSCSSP